MDNERIYACWLSAIRFLSAAQKHRLLEAAGTAEKIWHMNKSDISFYLKPKSAELIYQAKTTQNPNRIYEKFQKAGINYIFCRDDNFPERLLNIPDPPFGLFYKGKLPDESIPAVAMIGARKCSEYGRCMAEQLAREFGKYGINIISGMAMGIDGISQRAALEAGAKSYAVLGCGVDIVYPKSNQRLYEKLLENGGVLSEYPPGTEPYPILFPPRNRIISALSDVVLVVEAREKSGTLITVDMALEQGREVYVIPGRCTDNLSSGCNKLLRQGASVALCAEDIVNDMGWDRSLKAAEKKSEGLSSYINVKEIPEKEISPLSRAICSMLDILPITQDTIITLLREQNFRESISEICAELVSLELKGIIERRGGQYKLSDNIALKH